jgi:hypothetical protein
MKVKIRYGSGIDLTEEELNEIISFSEKYGEIETKQWGIRAGAIDLVTFLELGVFKFILDGFLKGFIDEEYFKKLGITTRQALFNEVDYFKKYLIAFYKVFISKKLSNHSAISIVEHIDGVVYFAVLNHKKSTENLISRLPNAFVRAVGEISLHRIPIENSFTVQLYPNFETETWDYLFIPTMSAFGNYIDRYYDFKLKKIVELHSREEFYQKFELDEDDIYKCIISAKYHEDRN